MSFQDIKIMIGILKSVLDRYGDGFGDKYEVWEWIGNVDLKKVSVSERGQEKEWGLLYGNNLELLFQKFF